MWEPWSAGPCTRTTSGFWSTSARSGADSCSLTFGSGRGSRLSGAQGPGSVPRPEQGGVGVFPSYPLLSTKIRKTGSKGQILKYCYSKSSGSGIEVGCLLFRFISWTTGRTYLLSTLPDPTWIPEVSDVRTSDPDLQPTYPYPPYLHYR